jgi:hypothetical protein
VPMMQACAISRANRTGVFSTPNAPLQLSQKRVARYRGYSARVHQCARLNGCPWYPQMHPSLTIMVATVIIVGRLKDYFVRPNPGCSLV